MERETFKKGMMLLSQAYQRDANKDMFTAYWLVLSDMSDESFMNAVERAVKTERFWPTPAVLRDHAAGGVSWDDGTEVITLVERAFRIAGAYRSVDFADSAINAAVRIMGGWPAVCSLDVDEWQSFRSKDLVKHVLHFRRYGVPEEVGKPVAGLAEMSAVKLGTEPEPPVRIGAPPSRALGSGEEQ